MLSKSEVIEYIFIIHDPILITHASDLIYRKNRCHWFVIENSSVEAPLAILITFPESPPE